MSHQCHRKGIAVGILSVTHTRTLDASRIRCAGIVSVCSSMLCVLDREKNRSEGTPIQVRANRSNHEMNKTQFVPITS